MQAYEFAYLPKGDLKSRMKLGTVSFETGTASFHEVPKLQDSWADPDVKKESVARLICSVAGDIGGKTEEEFLEYKRFFLNDFQFLEL